MRAAETEKDEGAAAALRADAEESQRRWRCPAAGYTPAKSSDELDAGCQSVHAGVRRLCGADELTTCPLHYLRMPWVHRAARARKWAERGQLTVVEPKPSAALIEAVDEIDSALAAREHREHEQRMAEIKEREKSKP